MSLHTDAAARATILIVSVSVAVAQIAARPVLAVPAQVCELAGTGSCQLLVPGDYGVTVSDLSGQGERTVHADDFVPLDTTLNVVCLWGAYLDGSKQDGEIGCSAEVTDDFHVRVFSNDDGIPGAMIGESSVTVVVIGEEPGTGYEATYFENTGERMFAYRLELLTPITGLTPGTCHWLEVSNSTYSDAGDRPNVCEWYWARKDSTIGNGGYSFAGTWDWNTNSSVYEPGGERAFDVAFCVDCGVDPGGCGEPVRTCCSCYDADPPSVCSLESYGDCIGNGIWDFESDTCDGYTCSENPPLGDTCAEAIEVADGWHEFEFNTTCAHSDGPGSILDENGEVIPFGSEIFLKYVATCTGFVAVSMCSVGSNYNSALALYRNEDNPYECPCPGEPGFQQHEWGADENCNGIHDGGAGYLWRPGVKNECWLIAVGGYDGDRGRGRIDVKCAHCDCPPAAPPEIEPSVPDRGSGTRNRYLSFVIQDPALHGIRVTLVNLAPPFDSLNGTQMYVGEPSEVTELSGETGDTPAPTFWAATLQCEPYYGDWTRHGAIHVHHELVVPGAEYDLQALDFMCLTFNCGGGGWSAPLTIVTSDYGDIVGTYDGTRWTSPQGFVDFDDISACVDKFLNAPGAVQKSRADVAPGTVDFKVDFTDIPAIVNGFVGLPYPNPPPPSTCP